MSVAINFQPSISPDGKRLAVANRGDGDIWIRDLERETTSRFTLDPATDGTPVWSPDGAYIYFTSDRSGSPDIYRKPSDGSGVPELVRSRHRRTTPYPLLRQLYPLLSLVHNPNQKQTRPFSQSYLRRVL